MDCVLDQEPILNLRLHPEHLFCAPYVDHALRTDAFPRVRGPFEVADSGPAGVSITAADGALWRIEPVGRGALRLRCEPAAHVAPSVTEALGLLSVPAPTRPLRVRRGARTLRVGHGRLALQFDLDRGDWRVRRGSAPLVATRGGGPRFGTEPAEYGGKRFLAAFELGPERVFGFGGRIAPLERTGTTADLYAVKAGALAGDYGGFPIPFFISTRGYGVFLNNPWPHVYFDMGKTRRDQWWVHAPGGSFDLFILDGPRVADLVMSFAAMVGRVPHPRRWWLGFWTSALAFATADDVRAVGERLRREGYPCDALVIDGPWRGGPEFLKKYMTDGEYPTNDLNWHPDFGDGPRMTRDLGAMGFNVVLHQNSRSWLKDTIERGVRDGAIRQVGFESVVTFGTEAGETFYAQAVRPRHREGIGLWWLDHGDRVSGELLPGIPSRNLFGSLWARATQRCAERDGAERRLSLIRGAGIGGQSAALPWPGDTRFGIDAFVEDLGFCMAAGLAGFPIVSVDLGGFMPAKGDARHNTAFDEDNLARRLCQGILVIPAPRMHQCDTDPPKLPWNCPPPVQRLYRDMLVERYRLTPYFFSYAIHASRTGEPILRPMLYHHMGDQRALAAHDQCYLGEWFLAAPVVRKGATERAVYLPAGQWICWWTGARFRGPKTVTVPAPLYEPRGLPLFVKAGAIVPRQEPTACLPDEVPAALTLDVFPAGRSTFDCRESETLTHRFVCRAGPRTCELTLPNGTDRPRHYELRMRWPAQVKQVRAAGRELAPRLWQWDAATRILTAFVEVAPRKSVRVRVC